MAKMGFRGRASVAGIDLGTTNSVICVQQLEKGVGKIECIPDEFGNVIVPSVVSFSSKETVVGRAAKQLIESHPLSTIYQAKRVLGRPFTDPSVTHFQNEVEFLLRENDDGEVVFHVGNHQTITPIQVGSRVVKHLLQMTNRYLGHENVKSAVICVPAKFDALQRQATVQAFREAGVSVQRILEEPAAAALAYGLHHKDGVDFILVYDFGGGTLDVSLLQVSGDGFVDVMGSDGDDRLGGADFDSAIAHYWLQQHPSVVERVHRHLPHMEHTDLPCLQDHPLCTASSFHTIGEQLKIQLSSSSNATVQAQCLGLEHDVDDIACSSLRPITLELTPALYAQIVQPLLDRSVAPIHRLLHDFQLSSHDIDEVVMVGGTTRMPQIRQLVQEALINSKVNTHIDPDITVAYGAASVID
jgi:molecular chaperone DnaK (HSP70)